MRKRLDTIYYKPTPERLIFKSKPGVSEEVVKQISKDKNEPLWMLKKRLESLELFKKMPTPDFGPDLSYLNLNKIHFYIKPASIKNSSDWNKIPKEIRQVYRKLGIPEAEKKYLAGAGAQYESEVVYHRIKERWKKRGVIFLSCEEGLRQYPEMFKKYFMTSCVSPSLHKFAALHGAVWSGGTFLYVPKGVKIKIPFQAYFRMNSERGGQFEHTLIIADEGSEVHYIEGCSAPQYSENSLHVGCVEIYVLKKARVRYSSIENWSKNTYNLNTKRALVYEDGVMEWVNGNLGSKVTMLYPSSILIGKNARTEYVGIAYASNGQIQDTGCKVYHLAPSTSSYIVSKSVCTGSGVISYRGLVKIKKGCINSKASVKCEGLMLGKKSKATTIPAMDIEEKEVEISHEASLGKIREEQLFYLMSRGLSKKEATKMIVLGFIEPLAKELPLEYAVELNRFIELEIENSII